MAQTKRELSDEGWMLAELVGAFIDRLRKMPAIDQNWLDVAEMDLKQGFVGLARSIAKPPDP